MDADASLIGLRGVARSTIESILDRAEAFGMRIDHDDRMTLAIEDLGSVTADLACSTDDDSHGVWSRDSQMS